MKCSHRLVRFLQLVYAQIGAPDMCPLARPKPMNLRVARVPELGAPSRQMRTFRLAKLEGLGSIVSSLQRGGGYRGETPDEKTFMQYKSQIVSSGTCLKNFNCH